MRDVIFQSLNERQKELNCLYGVLELFQNVNESLDFVFRKIVKLIPKGWQFSSVCVVRITFEDQIYCSEDFIEMVSSIRSIEKIKGTGRKEVSETEWITRRKYHVSMTSSQDIPAGTELIKGMVVYRNPGTGIPAKDAHKILGKRATQNILADELLSFDMFK